MRIVFHKFRGYNCPGIEIVRETLERLPVAAITEEEDRLHITFSRSLTPKEALLLGLLGPDNEIDLERLPDDFREITLWWD